MVLFLIKRILIFKFSFEGFGKNAPVEHFRTHRVGSHPRLSNVKSFAFKCKVRAKQSYTQGYPQAYREKGGDKMALRRRSLAVRLGEAREKVDRLQLQSKIEQLKGMRKKKRARR